MTACTVCGDELARTEKGWTHTGCSDSWLDHPPTPPGGWSCVCGYDDRQIQHLNGDPHDNTIENLNLIFDSPRFSAEWHRQHRTQHLERFPTADDRTRRALDDVVAYAEKIERGSSPPVDPPKE